MRNSLQPLFFLLLAVCVVSVQHRSSVSTRNDKCTASVAFSPIELNLPGMDYLAFQIKMEFANLNATNMTKRDNNHMIYKADFGNVSYLDIPYSVKRMDIFSPSLHMAFGVVYPLEVQLKAKTAAGDVITLAYLFDKFGNNHNGFLKSAGFHNAKIRNMSVSGDDVILTNDLSLRHLVGDKAGFMMYEGQSLVEVCEPSLIFVSSEISWMSETQFQELIPTGQMKETVARPKGMLVYQNFLEDYGSKPVKINAALELSRFPVHLQNVPAMYYPDEYHKLGYIPPDQIPAWQQLNGTLEDQPLLPVPSDMKLLPYCYRLIRPGVYTTRHIVVPKDYELAKNTQPEYIEVFIRTNTQYHNGVRDIIKINMPVEYTPIDKAAIQAIRAAEEKRLAAERKQAEKKVQVQKARAEAVKQRLKVLQATSTKKLKFKRVCEKWELENIVNRHWQNEAAWDLPDLKERDQQDLLVCRKWRVVLENDDGSEVLEKPIPKDPTPPAPAGNSTNSTTVSNSTSTAPAPPKVEVPDFGPIDVQRCGSYLTIVLNQRFQNMRVKDFVLDKCKDWQSQQIPTATALAAIRSTVRDTKQQTLKQQTDPSLEEQTDTHLEI